MIENPLALSSYKTLVFDCDGVLLDSNKVKTDAFYEAAKHLGEAYAKQLVSYHIANGGVSRYTKFEYFIVTILGKPFDKSLYDDLLDRFAKAVKAGMLTCAVAKNLDTLRKQTQGANWLVVSGGDQTELREIFRLRGLEHNFDGGIFGSPDIKESILEREKKSGNVTLPALFLGDSTYDYRASYGAGLDFVFISRWTEVKEWETWVNKNNLLFVEDLSDLCIESKI